MRFQMGFMAFTARDRAAPMLPSSRVRLLDAVPRLATTVAATLASTAPPVCAVRAPDARTDAGIWITGAGRPPVYRR